MKSSLIIFALTALVPLLGSICHAQEPASTLAHTRHEFSFTVDAPSSRLSRCLAPAKSASGRTIGTRSSSIRVQRATSRA